MGHSNGVITQAPVSVDDVRYVLGAASTDVGTLCKHSNINMWCKHKPVRFASLAMLREVSASAGVQVSEWKGNDPTNSPYGLSIKKSTEVYSNNLLAPIEYLKPTGGLASPYRLTDFSEYNHNCIVPFDVELPEGVHPRNEAQIRCMINNINVEDITNNLSLADLYPNCYFCIILHDGSTYYFKSIPVSNVSMTISDCELWSKGNIGKTVTIVACMCNKSIASWTTTPPSSTTLYSMACGNVNVQSTATIGEDYVNIYAFTVSFPSGVTSFVNVGHATYNNALGKVTARLTYIYDQVRKLGIHDNFNIQNVVITAVGNTDGKTYTKTVTTGFDADLEIGHDSYKDNPSGITLELSQSAWNGLVTSQTAKYTMMFNFVRV